MSKWLYRLEAEDPNNGLWYNSDNEYVWVVRIVKAKQKTYL